MSSPYVFGSLLVAISFLHYMQRLWSHTSVFEGLCILQWLWMWFIQSQAEYVFYCSSRVLLWRAGGSANGGCRVAEQRDPVVSSGVINASVCFRESQERVGCRAFPWAPARMVLTPPEATQPQVPILQPHWPSVHLAPCEHLSGLTQNLSVPLLSAVRQTYN